MFKVGKAQKQKGIDFLMGSKSPASLDDYRLKKEKEFDAPEETIVYKCGNCQSPSWFILSNGVFECTDCGNIATTLKHNG